MRLKLRKDYLREGFDYEALPPEFRQAVAWLHRRGFETADVWYVAETPCIHVNVMAKNLIAEADRVQDSARGTDEIEVQATYVPGEPALILIKGNGLLELRDE